METLSDEILLDIFLRLPDNRSMTECRSVCKRWHSLIRNSEPVIKEFFRSQPQLFKHVIASFPLSRPGLRRRNFEFALSKPEAPISETRLDFSPWPPAETDIRATFDDPILVSRRNYNCNPEARPPSPTDFSICNPVTKQWVPLPPAPENTARRWGLVCYRRKNRSRRSVGFFDDIRFVAVLFSRVADREDVLQPLVYCSESGNWERKPIFDAPDGWRRVFVIGGAIHWLSRSSIVSYDPLLGQSRLVDLPVDQLRVPLQWNGGNFGRRVVGFVAGRLRLWQSVCDYSSAKEYYLRVWEYEPLSSSSLLSSFLSSSSPFSWRLVHSAEESMRMPRKKCVAMLALHPENVDEVFMVFEDQSVWLYNILEDSFEQVGKIPPVENSTLDLRTSIADLFTLSHPLPPTLIPELPSTSDSNKRCNFD